MIYHKSTESASNTNQKIKQSIKIFIGKVFLLYSKGLWNLNTGETDTETLCICLPIQIINNKQQKQKAIN